MESVDHGRNPTHRRRIYRMHIVQIERHAASVFENLKHRFDQRRQESIHIVGLDARQIVIGRVSQQAAEAVGPREVIQNTLFRLHSASNDFSIHVVGQHIQQTRFDGERIVEEFLIEIFLHVMHQDDGDALVAELWSTGSTHHLQHIGDWHVHVTLQFAVVVLGTLDDDQMGWQIDTPRKRCGRNENLNLCGCD